MGGGGLGSAGRRRSGVGSPLHVAAVMDISSSRQKVSPRPPHTASPCKYRLPGTNKAFCGAASPSASASALLIVHGNLRDR